MYKAQKPTAHPKPMPAAIAAPTGTSASASKQRQRDGEAGQTRDVRTPGMCEVQDAEGHKIREGDHPDAPWSGAKRLTKRLSASEPARPASQFQPINTLITPARVSEPTD